MMVRFGSGILRGPHCTRAKLITATDIIDVVNQMVNTANIFFILHLGACNQVREIGPTHFSSTENFVPYGKECLRYFDINSGSCTLST
jgi:hypothetical protein